MDDISGKREAFFSVIIPTLNEAKTIGVCISNIRSMEPDTEVIVTDGGSIDATVQVAESAGATVIQTGLSRGHQCNSGAAIASGEVLIFLHADTILPATVFDKLTDIFSNSEVQVGNFGIRFDTNHWLLRLFGFLSHFDMGFFRFGDQGIVIRKSLFNDLGGFQDWGLFEDMALIRKARKRTRIHRLPMHVTTSARRFRRNGILRQQLINIYYTIQYMSGVSPARLSKKYYGHGLAVYEASLVIFMRLAKPGEVKTRLARTLGVEAAVKFYYKCVGHLLGETEKLPAGIVRYIYFTPRKNKEEIQNWVGSGLHLYPQAGGGLGKRLKAAFRDQFKLGIKKVIAVASDVPDLSAPDIEEAVAALDKADLVIGPNTDGGYYLIGMADFYPALFYNISWSTEVVYQQTLSIAEKLGLNVYKLRSLDDIDTEDDLLRWQARSKPQKDGYVTPEGNNKGF